MKLIFWKANLLFPSYLFCSVLSCPDPDPVSSGLHMIAIILKLLMAQPFLLMHPTQKLL